MRPRSGWAKPLWKKERPMETQELVALISRWLHIFSAIALVGGTIFIRFALVPALAAEGRDGADDSVESMVYRRWARIVMGAIAWLLITGIYNAAIMMVEYDLGPLYNALLGIKMLLAVVIFAMASLLAGRSAVARRLRTRERTWLNLNLLLMIALVGIAGYLKQMDPPPRTASSNDTAQVDIP